MREVTDGIVFTGGLVQWWGQDCTVLKLGGGGAHL